MGFRSVVIGDGSARYRWLTMTDAVRRSVQGVAVMRLHRLALAPIFVPITSPDTISSTRRFCCLPDEVLLVATGLVSPKPEADKLSRGTPWLPRYTTTASARFTESR